MDLEALESALKEAAEVAKQGPGPNNGRYVACRYDKAKKASVYFVMGTDDPDAPEVKKHYASGGAILAHVQRNGKAYGLGTSRYYINEDCTVDRDYFKRK